MEKQSAFRRIIVPAIPVLAAMIISINAFDLSMKIAAGTLKTVVVYVSVLIMFGSIWLGPLLVNSLAFFRGASFPERMLAGLITPAVWIGKTYVYFIGIYSFGELVYLILHPFILGNIGVNLLCIGISELVCRGRIRRGGGNVPLSWFRQHCRARRGDSYRLRRAVERGTYVLLLLHGRLQLAFFVRLPLLFTRHHTYGEMMWRCCIEFVTGEVEPEDIAVQ